MLDQSTLDDIIRRIVEVAHPEKIILFGSAARGDLNRHSDVDLLALHSDLPIVIASNGINAGAEQRKVLTSK